MMALCEYVNVVNVIWGILLLKCFVVLGAEKQSKIQNIFKIPFSVHRCSHVHSQKTAIFGSFFTQNAFFNQKVRVCCVLLLTYMRLRQQFAMAYA
jgi:hypothetical protein